MSSKSFAEPLGVWVGTRMPAARFLPVALVLTAGAAAAGTPGVPWMLAAFAAALLLIFQFRLWDDLADAERDRIDHPERILPGCESRQVFRLAAYAAFAINLLALAALGGTIPALGLVALTAFYAAWYAREPRRRLGLIGAHVVVAKYPVFALLLAPAHVEPVRAALACATVYLIFSAHELSHDPAYSGNALARKLLAAELGLLALILAALTTVILFHGELT